MAKEVKFNIHLSTSGKEGVVASLRDISVVAQNAVSSIQQLSSVITEWTDANKVQQEAEVKLATVMRQRMAATTADVEAIKSLAAAQQELGIIGDEVQLMGAQQLSTFLNQRAALETLIPAMNNLLAQQKGYNASAGDAVNIGNLLGKVMQGQTSALTRVGITFDEAQQKILQTGDEMQRAATLAEVITANVGEMNAALAQTDAGKAAQLSNTMGDLKEQFGAVFSQLQPTIVAIGQLGMAIGAITSMGTAIRGLGAAFVMLGKSAALASARVKIASVAMYGWNKAAVLARASTIAATLGLKGMSIACRTASIAIRSLYIASGVGAAIAILTTAIDLFVNKTDKAKEKSEALDEELVALKARSEQAKAAWQAQKEMEEAVAEAKKLSATAKTPKNEAEDKSLEYLKQYEDGIETINSLEAKIADLKRQQADADIVSALALQEQIEKLEERRGLFTGEGGVIVTNEIAEEPETDWLAEYERGVRNIAAYEAKIAELRAQQRTVGSDQYKEIEKQVEALEKEQDAFKGIQEAAEEAADEIERISGEDAFKGAYSGIKGISSGVEGITQALEESGTAWEKAISVVDGFVSIYDGIKQVVTIIQALTAVSQAMTVAKTAEATATAASTTATAADATASAVATTAALPEVVAAKALVQVYAQLAAARYMAAHASIPFVGFATGAAFASSSTALIQAVGAIPFAKGGIVSGATLALVGEYPGAANNPEVIAPLDQLRSMMNGGGGGNISLRVQGRDLVGVLSNETRVRSKSGKRTNIVI